jgi:hypothetical protein
VVQLGFELTRDNLAPEGLARGHLEIMAEFQVVSEAEGVCYSHVSEALEKVHLAELVRALVRAWTH